VKCFNVGVVDVISCCNNLCYGKFFMCQLGHLMLKRMKLKQSDPCTLICSRFHKNKTFFKKDCTPLRNCRMNMWSCMFCVHS
jgi:hypothetical protein